MKKITFISQSFIPENGACPSRLHSAVKALQNYGWEVDVITALPNYPTGKIFKGYRGRLFKKETIDGITVRRYWMYASNSFRGLPRAFSMLSFFYMSLWSIFYLLRRKPDIILAQSPPLTVGLSGRILARLTKAKLVLNISDLWPSALVELGGMKRKSVAWRFLRRVEKRLYKKAALCVGQSDEIITYLKENGVTNHVLARTAADVNRFTLHLNDTTEKFKIVYAGLLGAAQHIAGFCEKVDFKAVDVELHIYGNGGERKVIQDYLKNHLEKGIFLHEAVDFDKIPEILSRYDAALVPVKKRVYGNVSAKIYESAAAGLPILYCGGGESAELVEKYGIGLVSPPEDYASFIKNLNKLKSLSQEEFFTIKKKCRATAVHYFDRADSNAAMHKKLLELVS